MLRSVGAGCGMLMLVFVRLVYLLFCVRHEAPRHRVEV